MIIAEETEDSVPLQRPMATHNEPSLPWLPLFLWERDLGVTEGDSRLRGRDRKPPTSQMQSHVWSPSVWPLFTEGSSWIP